MSCTPLPKAAKPSGLINRVLYLSEFTSKHKRHISYIADSMEPTPCKTKPMFCVFFTTSLLCGIYESHRLLWRLTWFTPLPQGFRWKLRGSSMIISTCELHRLTKSIVIVLSKVTYNDFFHSASQTSGLTM